MQYWIECRGHDPMFCWNCGPLTSVRVEQRFGDDYPKVYVIRADTGFCDVIDPAVWDCRFYVLED